MEHDLVSDRVYAFVIWMHDALGVPFPADGLTALDEAMAHVDALRSRGVQDTRALVEGAGRAVIETRLASGWLPPTVSAPRAHGA